MATHRPRKRFGQNFLQDQHVIAQILQSFNPKLNDKVLEIGPGLGALTRALLPYLDKLIAVEIDRDLHAHLLKMPEANKLQLVQGDALNLDYRQWGKDLRLIGNLPYNISTALITQLLSDVDWIEDMHFMVQKEVAERLVASPSCKAYGRLSVFLQYHCAAEYLFTVPASAFYPAPKVESAVVRLRPYRQRPYEVVDVAVLERVIAMAFAMRRKTLANNLKALLKADELVALGIDPSRRPEQIHIAEYVQIVKFVSS